MVGPAALLDGKPLAGELRRQRALDGTVSVVTHGAGALEGLRKETGVRVEPLSLEDLFIEVTQ